MVQWYARLVRCMSRVGLRCVTSQLSESLEHEKGRHTFPLPARYVPHLRYNGTCCTVLEGHRDASQNTGSR